MPTNEITVKQLNTYVKTLLESDSRLSFISVRGELSNFKCHFSSGHWYFTLKDNDASVRCIMFSASAKRVKFFPEDGMSVSVKGRVSLYEKDGQYQFYVEEMSILGAGDIAFEFFKLKEQLQKEGLFDAESKRPIEKFPKRIAVVTSGSGAAAEDIKNVMSRRYPRCEIVMCPVSVQGSGAAKQIIDVLDRIYLLDGIDTVIIGRGGGSAEDLLPFNDEALVRKVYESPFPVISAVGHETDFTLCDFAADLRAPTPSAAAELAVPDGQKLMLDIKKYRDEVITQMSMKLGMLNLSFDSLSVKLKFNNPDKKIERLSDKIFSLKQLCVSKAQQNHKNKAVAFSENALKLDALNPMKVLLRGYSVAQANGVVIKSVDQTSVGEDITVTFSDGSAECTVNTITKKV